MIVRGSFSGNVVMINPNTGSKVVFTRTIAEAEGIHKLSDAIAASPVRNLVQRVIARRGATLEQNYIRGKIIGDKPVSVRVANEVAKILAGMHSVKIPRGLPNPSVDAISKRIGRSIADLRAHHALSPSEANRVMGRFKEIPKKQSIAICHMDVNKDNVVELGKSVRIIDIMDARVYFREFDIAKTIFGLRLSPQLEAKFINAYQKAGGDVAGFSTNKKFWMDLVILSKLRAADERRRIEKTPEANRKFLRLKELLLAP